MCVWGVGGWDACSFHKLLFCHILSLDGCLNWTLFSLNVLVNHVVSQLIWLEMLPIIHHILLEVWVSSVNASEGNLSFGWYVIFGLYCRKCYVFWPFDQVHAYKKLLYFEFFHLVWFPSYLVAAAGLQSLWSLSLGILDVYALLVGRCLQNSRVVSLFAVGDGVSCYRFIKT